jgi:ABC-type glycerol-3-phosphate transport system permease component
MLIFRSFFEQIPQDLVASARIDGCSERQVLTKIITPLTRPILITGAVLVALGVWGDYLWPMIVLQNYHQFTISPGIQEFLGQFGQSVYGGGADFAAYVLATAPMFLLIAVAGKYFIAGVTDGGLKM